MKKLRSAVIMLMFASLWGCSNANDNSIVLDLSGKHPAGWFVAINGGNHPATYLSAPDKCTECHGTDLTGGVSKVSCFSADRNGMPCHAQGPYGHPEGWSSPAAHGAHAKAAAAGADGLAFCTNCHGADYRGGGNSQKDCLRCHATAPHSVAANWRSTGPITHTNTAQNNAPVCAGCHNSSTPNHASSAELMFANSPAGSFKGGSPSCFSASLCHGDVRKTSNCDACHSIATSIPFKSLAGASGTNDPKVGAHVKHLSASVQVPFFSANIPCSECHAVPASPAVSGTHRDGANDIVFGTLAKTGSLTPSYATATGECANTYCHGTTLTGGGSDKMPAWNQGGYLVAAGCGTCHGFPPITVRNGAAAHSASSACSGCHSHVNVLGNGFIDSGKHINGVVDASAAPNHPGAIPLTNPVYPGATHKGVGAGFVAACGGCHDYSSITGVYPAASSMPPKCAGCHLIGLNSGAAPSCSDCHGDATTGRPNGNSFPNRQGEHLNGAGKHSNLACTLCHLFTTGDIRHGWSAGTKSTNAQVLPALNWNPGTRTAGQGSCNPSAGGLTGCHGSEGGWY